MNLEQILRIATTRRSTLDGSARDIRLRANLTLAEMAAAVGGVSGSTIWRWENGQRQPRGDAALRWAEVLIRLDTEQETFSTTQAA